MILCLKCKRLWPKGTVWCGTCGATLKARLCPEKHSNQLTSTCCQTCGSRSLTPGVRALNLRPVTFMALLGLAVIGVKAILGQIIPNLLPSLYGLLGRIESLFFGLVVFSLLLMPILSDKGRENLSNIWVGAFKLLLKTLMAFAHLVLVVFKAAIKAASK